MLRMFSHVVIFWTAPAQPNAAAELIAGANHYLKSIPGVLQFHVGKIVRSHHPVVDRSYQVALNLTFPDKQAQHDYQVHPLHVEFAEKVFKRVCQKVAVYVFERLVVVAAEATRLTCTYAASPRRRLWPRMKLPVNVPQSVPGDVRVNLRCADARVAEQFLDDTQIRPVLQQMCREAVPQHMRRHIALHPCAANAPLDAQPQRHRRERRTAFREENVRR